MNTESFEQVVERLASDPEIGFKVRNNQVIEYGGFNSLDVWLSLSQKSSVLSDIFFITMWSEDSL